MSMHETAGQPNPNGVVRCVLLGFALTILCAGLIGCDHARDTDAMYVALSDTAKRHPIVVARDRVDMGFPLAGDGGGLEPGAYFQVTRLARRYRQTGKGRILISAPPSHRYRRDVVTALNDVRSAIRKAGVTNAQIAYGPPPGDIGGGAEEIRVSFDRVAALGPSCGDWSEDATHNREMLPYANFGCATQHNLAAMVAHPTDLIYPAEETPRPAERREAVWRKYIDTGSAASESAGSASVGGAKTN